LVGAGIPKESRASGAHIGSPAPQWATLRKATDKYEDYLDDLDHELAIRRDSEVLRPSELTKWLDWADICTKVKEACENHFQSIRSRHSKAADRTTVSYEDE